MAKYDVFRFGSWGRDCSLFFTIPRHHSSIQEETVAHDWYSIFWISSKITVCVSHQSIRQWISWQLLRQFSAKDQSHFNSSFQVSNYSFRGLEVLFLGSALYLLSCPTTNEISGLVPHDRYISFSISFWYIWRLTSL